VELFSPSSGWGNLRKRINQTQPPLIVPPSIFLHDSMAILENDDYWDDDKKLLNFHKLRLFSGVLRLIARCQVEPFVFRSVKPIQDFLLKHLLVLSEQELEQEVNSVLMQESLPHNSRLTLRLFSDKDKDKDKDKPQSPRLIPLNPKERKPSSSYSHFVLPSLSKSPRAASTNSNDDDHSTSEEISASVEASHSSTSPKEKISLSKLKERANSSRNKDEKDTVKMLQNRNTEKLKNSGNSGSSTTSSGDFKITKGRSNSTGFSLPKTPKKEKKDNEKRRTEETMAESNREVTFLEFLREDPAEVLEKKEKKDKKRKKRQGEIEIIPNEKSREDRAIECDEGQRRKRQKRATSQFVRQATK